MKKWLLIVLSLAGFTVPAMATERCYSPAEIQAEQTLRLHSELMVITVTCRQGSSGEDLVRAYTGFTRNNIQMLRESETTMTNYYKKAYGGKGVDRLDKLRTLLANEYGQRSADMSAPAFCAKNRDKVLALHNAGPSAVQGEIMQVAGKSYEPPCSAIIRTAKKSR